MKQLDFDSPGKSAPSKPVEWFLNLHTSFKVMGDEKTFIEQIFHQDEHYPNLDKARKFAQEKGGARLYFEAPIKAVEVCPGIPQLRGAYEVWDVLCSFRGFDFSEDDLKLFLSQVLRHPGIMVAQIYFDVTKAPAVICGNHHWYEKPFTCLPLCWTRSAEYAGDCIGSRGEYSDKLDLRYRDDVDPQNLCVRHVIRRTYSIDCVEPGGSRNHLLLEAETLVDAAQYAMVSRPGRRVVKVEEVAS